MDAHASHGHTGDGHDPNVAHHFENADQQYQSAKLGMWLFLATEVLFFGGLFVAYAVYRSNHPEIFIYAHQFLDKSLGAVNTVILICSSLTMAWAVRAAQLRQRGMLMLMLGLTFLCATGFLGIKAVEYEHKWKHGLLWARAYSPDAVHGEEAGAGDHGGSATDATPESDHPPQDVPEAADAVVADPERSTIPPAAEGPSGLAPPGDLAADAHAHAEEPRHASIFFSIYFMMTGLHGIHVLLGMAAMAWLAMKARRGDFDGGHFTAVDMVGLYWHLVDLIWIYLFLLLYLID